MLFDVLFTLQLTHHTPYVSMCDITHRSIRWREWEFEASQVKSTSCFIRLQDGSEHWHITYIQKPHTICWLVPLPMCVCVCRVACRSDQSNRNYTMEIYRIEWNAATPSHRIQPKKLKERKIIKKDVNEIDNWLFSTPPVTLNWTELNSKRKMN